MKTTHISHRNWFLLLLLISMLLTDTVIGKTYKGAELRTLATFQYGRFEVRMKTVSGSGTVSSFFTYHQSSNQPAEWNEIDIEVLGRYNDVVQFNIITQGQINHEFETTVDYNPKESFHIYAFEWTPDYVAWSIDGIEVYRELGDHVQQLVFRQNLFMNIWPPTITAWVGTLDPDMLPVQAFYDWVKYYSYTPGSNGNFTHVWTDDFDTYDQSRWIKSNNVTWSINNSDFITENTVFQDGYLVLSLTKSDAIGYTGDPIIDEDIDPPTLAWARLYEDHAILRFSEPLDPVSATDLSNYIVSPFIIENANLLADQRTVRLNLSGVDPTIITNIITRNIGDLALPPNLSALAVKRFILPITLTAEINIAGENVNSFLGDQDYTADLEYGRTGGTTFSHPAGTAFANTDDDVVYESELRNPRFYNIRVPEGHYFITFLFAETEIATPSGRLFNIYAEEQLIQENVDIYTAAGLQQFSALELTVPSIAVADGILSLYFEPIVGEPVLSGLVIHPVLSDIDVPETIAKNFEWAVFPNPFNPTSQIKFSLAEAAYIKIYLYDINGRLIRTISDGRRPTGLQQLKLHGGNLASGIYLLVLQVDQRQKFAKKIALIK